MLWGKKIQPNLPLRHYISLLPVRRAESGETEVNAACVAEILSNKLLMNTNEKFRH